MIAALATVTAPRGRIAPPACSFKTIVTRAITAGGGSVQLHRQADALARGIHLQHFDFHNLAGFHHLAGIFDKLVAHLADVDQTVLVDAQIDKRPKLRHVADGTLQHHAFF